MPLCENSLKPCIDIRMLYDPRSLHCIEIMRGTIARSLATMIASCWLVVQCTKADVFERSIVRS
jgi:hypothetical protein